MTREYPPCSVGSTDGSTVESGGGSDRWSVYEVPQCLRGLLCHMIVINYLVSAVEWDGSFVRKACHLHNI